MSLDRVPGEAELFIGGLFALRRKEALKKANITHVVSALCLPLDEQLFEGYRHLVLEVDDVEDENILQYFATSNAFIQEGLNGGGGVLVHCAMGRSRSTTILIAYLLSTNLTLNPQAALDLIRHSRPFADPNSGFVSQLELYHRMLCPSDPDSQPLYQRWLYQRNVEASIAAGMAPGAEEIRFGELSLAEKVPSKQDSSARPSSTWRCRRCRTPLATSEYLLPHAPRALSQPQLASRDLTSSLPSADNNAPLSPACSHLFLDPLSWMRPELEKGLLSGRLECPNQRCGQNVGRYAWQGMKCSCGEWVVPGITVAKGRVDETKALQSPTRKDIGGKI